MKDRLKEYKCDDANEVLSSAVQKNDLEMVKFAINSLNANHNIISVKGDTLLMIAIKLNHIKIAEYLSQICDINVTNKNNETAFMIACKCGCYAMVEYLHKNCKDLNLYITNKTKKNCLSLSFKKSNVLCKTIVKYLIEECKMNPNNYIGVSNVDNNIITFNLDDNVYKKALHNKCFDLVMYLMEYNKDIMEFISLSLGTTKKNHSLYQTYVDDLLKCACAMNNLQLVKILVTKFDAKLCKEEKKQFTTALLIVVQKGYISLLNYLIEAFNINVNQLDKRKKSLLYYASSTSFNNGGTKHNTKFQITIFKIITSDEIEFENKKLQTMKCLIEKHKAIVDINILLMVITRNHQNIVKYLCNKFDHLINEVNEVGDTPLIVQCYYSDDLEAVKAIADKTHNINAKNKCKTTALLAAISKGNVDIVNYILNKNKQWPLSALMRACKVGNLELVKLLLKTKPIDFDINKVDEDKSGCNALYNAADSGNIQLVEYLLNEFKDTINVNIMNKEGKTILEECIELNDHKFIKLLAPLSNFHLIKQKELLKKKTIHSSTKELVKYLRLKYDQSAKL